MLDDNAVLVIRCTGTRLEEVEVNEQ
jgi:hypothetical protein